MSILAADQGDSLAPNIEDRPVSVPTAARPHLAFLDGLRGLAALYVVLHHGYLEVNGMETGAVLGNGLVRHATNWLLFGRAAVDIFIVLSGYCLMLPVARASSQEFGSVAQFFRRRARRILPPYYAALVLSCLLILLVPGLQHTSDVFWGQALPAFTPAVLLSHALLIHNLFPSSAHRVDYPMWSVATEWQIYFLFPAVLLPLWRRCGTLATVLIAVLMGLLPLAVFPKAHDHLIYDVAPHFLGLFALGMAAATINYPRHPARSAGSRLPWGSLALMQFIGYCLLNKMALRVPVVAMDVLVGTATACLLAACMDHLAHRREGLLAYSSLVVRLLQTRSAVGLGKSSYSLYLVHAPVLALLRFCLGTRHVAPAPMLLVLLSLGTLLALLAAQGFHLLFEKPFMNTPRKQPISKPAPAPQTVGTA